ncbi:Polyamine-modulated factor 1 [Dissostichus eleginoides]|uniref:Polyamine-modulated factor 1 n=1 Tax=Dissostichus eleginoides TaxID=100907 RepID=A0AAD9BN45_DISEL|nr:Polyamine-modulated factor 1 [Dissostichus eleginoides]
MEILDKDNKVLSRRIQNDKELLRLKEVLKNDHANLESERRTLEAQNLVLCKTMENKFLLSQNKDLQKTLDHLEKKLSKEQTQTLKNHLVTEENGALIQVNSHLEHQIREVRYSLQGESILDIALDSLLEEKKELKVQKAALKKDLTELRKTESRERSQQEKRTALRGENGNLRRDQEVLRGNIRDQENLPSCSQAETKSPCLLATFFYRK